MGTELFHVDEQADRHDEVNSPFLQFVKVLNKFVFIHMILPVLCMKWKIAIGLSCSFCACTRLKTMCYPVVDFMQCLKGHLNN